MIKITFEVSEDLIRENATPETAVAKLMAADGEHATKALFDMLAFIQLDKLLEQGKTDFVVTTDKLDDKSRQLYDATIGEICVLAAFSETDKEGEPAE